jgi:hypothetical protein
MWTPWPAEEPAAPRYFAVRRAGLFPLPVSPGSRVGTQPRKKGFIHWGNLNWFWQTTLGVHWKFKFQAVKYCAAVSAGFSPEVRSWHCIPSVQAGNQAPASSHLLTRNRTNKAHVQRGTRMT